MKPTNKDIILIALAALNATIAFFAGVWFIAGLLNQILSITQAIAMILGAITCHIFMSLLEKEDQG